MPELLSATSGPAASRRYKILGVVGTGGFGTVYLAESLGEQGFARRVAIKFADKNARQQARLFDEALLLSRLEHDHIVRAIDLISVLGQPALVLEYVDGVSLRDVLEAEVAVPPRPALEIIGRVADALEHAFHHPGPDGRPLGLIHRDISPSNIMLTASGGVKLLDFGIARGESEQRHVRTTDALPLPFTQGYRAPERALGQTFGPPADIHALGAVLYAMLTREQIGDFEPGSLNAESYQRRISARLDSLAAKLEGAPGAGYVIALVENMLAWSAESRPVAQDVVAAVEQSLAEVAGPSVKPWIKETLARVPASARALGRDSLTGRVISADVTGGVSTEVTQASVAPPAAAASVSAPSVSAPSVSAPSVAVAPAAAAPASPPERATGGLMAKATAGLAIVGVVALLIALLGPLGSSEPVVAAAPEPAHPTPEPPVPDGPHEGGTPGDDPGPTKPVDNTTEPAAAAELDEPADEKPSPPQPPPAPPVTSATPKTGKVNVASAGGATRIWIEVGGAQRTLHPGGASLSLPPGTYRFGATDGGWDKAGSLTVQAGGTVSVTCNDNLTECTTRSR